MARWLTPKERAQQKLVDVYHVPMWEGDYQGQMKQLSLFEAYSVVGYAEGEKKFSWDLPGHGYALIDCGKGFMVGCDRHLDHANGKDVVRVKRHNCHRKECPVCFESWSALQAERSLMRIATYLYNFDFVEHVVSKAKKQCMGKSGHVYHELLDFMLEDYIHSCRRQVKHVVLSPPQDVVCEKIGDYRKLRDLAYRVARESGFYGGAVIFHPYRLKCSKCGSAISEYQKKCSKCHESAFQWFWSPHFHGVGFGWIENTKEGYARHGWVVKNLGVRDSVFWTFQYLLSHAGVSCVHTTTWFGKLGYNMMGKVPKSDGFHEVCQFCLRALVPLRWIGGEDRGPPVYDEDHQLNELLLDPGLVSAL